jgi:hypothetical protein
VLQFGVLQFGVQEFSITSIPACRKTLRAGKNSRYFDFQHQKFYVYFNTLTSIPAYRDAPCNETNRRYFGFKRHKICQRSKISIHFHFSYIVYVPQTLLAYQFRKLLSRRHRPLNLQRTSFYTKIRPLMYDNTIKLLSPFKHTYRLNMDIQVLS